VKPAPLTSHLTGSRGVEARSQPDRKALPAGSPLATERVKRVQGSGIRYRREAGGT
jgi:hypothetical protein